MTGSAIDAGDGATGAIPVAGGSVVGSSVGSVPVAGLLHQARLQIENH